MSSRNIGDLTDAELEVHLDRHLAGADAIRKEQKRRREATQARIETEPATPLCGTAGS
jgi:hypothetical protein